MFLFNKLELFSTKLRGIFGWQSFPNDAAYEAAKGGPGQAGEHYWNSTTLVERMHNGTTWLDRTVQSQGILVQPTVATVSAWQPLQGVTRTAANKFQILIASGIDGLAIKGTPLRYSDNNSTWQHGVISDVTPINPSTLELTIEGVELTASNDGFAQIGTPNNAIPLIVPTIVGNLVVNDDLLDVNNNTELIWTGPDAYLVFVSAKLKTAASGANATIAVAFNNPANEAVELNLAQSTNRVSSGTSIVHANAFVQKGQKIYIKGKTIGSGTPGANLSLQMIFVATPFTYQEFIPVAAPEPPYANIWNGISNSIINATLETFSLATQTGGGNNRATRSVASFSGGVVYDAVRIFCGGGSTNTTTGVITTIEYVETQTLNSTVSDRQELPAAKVNHGSASGSIFGFFVAGALTNAGLSQTAIATIFNVQLSVLSGDAVNSSAVLNNVRLSFASGQSNDTAVFLGGRSGGSAITSVESLDITTQTASGNNRAALATATSAQACVSSTLQVYACGGRTAGATSGTTTIFSMDFSDLTVAAANRGSKNLTSHQSVGASGAVDGNIAGGLNSATDFTPVALSDIEIFTFTTGTISVNNRDTLNNNRAIANSTT